MLESSPSTVSIEHVRAGDCIHHGILSAPGEAPLGEIAGLMARHRVHAIAITRGGSLRPVGVISDLDVAAALAIGADVTAAQAAATEHVSISAEQSLRHAAQLMAEHGVSHLIVLDAAGGYPVGVLSTLDIAVASVGLPTEDQAS
jgi:CBS domain-containing protein